MKILITGSHFTPAQAVIDELLKNKDIEIVYVGRKYTREGDKTASIESQVLPQKGVKFISLTSGRLQRSFTIYTIPSLLKIPFGFLQSLYILIKENPDAILSFGGYIAVPVVITGWLLSKKIIIHEQTMVSGLANQISSFFADKIAVTFANSKFPKNKIVITGNPLRKEITKPINSINDPEVSSLLKKPGKFPVILITGGNQGSHIINQAVKGCLESLAEFSYVIHQTGDSKFKDFEAIEEKRRQLKNPERYVVRKWFDAKEFGYIFSKVDLVVSRAGANSLLEYAYHKIPSLLIPIPYLYKNEQVVNAKYFKEMGLSEILTQKELTSQNLLLKIKDMVSELPVLDKAAKKSPEVNINDAAQRLALETIVLASSSKNG